MAQRNRELVRKREIYGSTATDRAQWIQASCAAMLNDLNVVVRIEGAVPKAPAVFVANHLSYLDPLIVAAQSPLTVIAKDEVQSWPLLGSVLGELGVIFVRRGCGFSGARALRNAKRLVDKNIPLLVFAEGTTSVGDTVLPFALGAFGLARLCNVPVVPITIRYNDSAACWVGDDTLIAHQLRLHKNDRIGASIHFGTPVNSSAFATDAAFAEHVRRTIAQRLNPTAQTQIANRQSFLCAAE
ncbi:MAG: lysophospholipid acyltransferase family protein [Polyangiales bacterium]